MFTPLLWSRIIANNVDESSLFASVIHPMIHSPAQLKCFSFSSNSVELAIKPQPTSSTTKTVMNLASFSRSSLWLRRLPYAAENWYKSLLIRKTSFEHMWTLFTPWTQFVIVIYYKSNALSIPIKKLIGVLIAHEMYMIVYLYTFFFFFYFQYQSIIYCYSIGLLRLCINKEHYMIVYDTHIKYL